MAGNVEKVTRRSLAAGVADRWLEAYGEDGSGFGDDKVEILHQLRALGSRPSAAAVDAIIGNNSWTAIPDCDVCEGKSRRWAIRVGEEQDYNSRTVHLCPACANRVALLARATQPLPPPNEESK